MHQLPVGWSAIDGMILAHGGNDDPVSRGDAAKLDRGEKKRCVIVCHRYIISTDEQGHTRPGAEKDAGKSKMCVSVDPDNGIADQFAGFDSLMCFDDLVQC